MTLATQSVYLDPTPIKDFIPLYVKWTTRNSGICGLVLRRKLGCGGPGGKCDQGRITGWHVDMEEVTSDLRLHHIVVLSKYFFCRCDSIYNRHQSTYDAPILWVFYLCSSFQMMHQYTDYQIVLWQCTSFLLIYYISEDVQSVLMVCQCSVRKLLLRESTNLLKILLCSLDTLVIDYWLYNYSTLL